MEDFHKFSTYYRYSAVPVAYGYMCQKLYDDQRAVLTGGELAREIKKLL
jgi:hypothetical protein